MNYLYTYTLCVREAQDSLCQRRSHFQCCVTQAHKPILVAQWKLVLESRVISVFWVATKFWIQTWIQSGSTL